MYSYGSSTYEALLLCVIVVCLSLLHGKTQLACHTCPTHPDTPHPPLSPHTAYIVYSSLADTEMFKRAKRPRARGTETKKTEHNPEEWLKGTAHDQFQKAKAAKAAGATKKAA